MNQDRPPSLEGGYSLTKLTLPLHHRPELIPLLTIRFGCRGKGARLAVCFTCVGVGESKDVHSKKVVAYITARKCAESLMHALLTRC